MKKLRIDSKITSLPGLSGPLLTISTPIRIAFSRWHYIVIAGVISTLFWIIFSVFDQLLFFACHCILPTRRCHFGIYSLHYNCNPFRDCYKYEYLCVKTFKGFENKLWIIFFWLNFRCAF
jgi:hypothetical protein